MVLINKSISLSGGWNETFTAQSGTSTIDGGGAKRGIKINDAVTATVEFFTIQNGYGGGGGGIHNIGTLILNNSIVSGNIGDYSGGGILNSGMLTINDTIINNNSLNDASVSHSEGGGGIYNASGILKINYSDVNNNDADHGSGGGISNYGGDMTINDSNISKNVSQRGGGIFSETYFGDGSLTVNNTTINANKAGFNNYAWAGAGGIFSSTPLILNNSTVSNNTIFGDYYKLPGSGIYLLGDATLTNNTISGNVNNQSSSYSYDGAGIFIGSDTSSGKVIIQSSTVSNHKFGGITLLNGILSLRNTIVAGNGTNGDCRKTLYGHGSINSKGYNLIGNGTGCSFTPTTGDQVGTSTSPIFPELTPLQNNGGPTMTHALYAISPALNAGNPAAPGSGGGACPGTDQRNITRPVGPRCDVGAYEGSIPAIYPALLSPKEVIIDTTPAFKWRKINGASDYNLQLVKGTSTVYSITVTSSACNAYTCTQAPATVLDFANNYKWRVRAKIGGVWKTYSAYRAFELSPAKTGYWSWSDDSPRFYILKSKAIVADFSILVSNPTCGVHRITHSNDAVIKGRDFLLTAALGGGFNVRGTFSNTTHVSGTLYLRDYYIPGCGYATGGPFPWSAVWKNGTQPTILLGMEDAIPVTITPGLQSVFDLLTIEPEK